MLSHTHRFLLAPSLLLLALLVPSANTSEPTTKQIVDWVDRLGDNDFKVRENASQKLWEAGAAAESALEKALQSSDREVVRRARELLDKFRWGIYPDTPADIVALIRAYQSSEGNPRLEVLQKLLDSGEAGLRAALKIAAAEKDEHQRKLLGELIANKLPAAFHRAIMEGKYEPFERLLELGHEGKFIGANQYAAYWLLRGKLAERIAHFRARLRDHPEDKWTAQTLAYLYRANGDLTAARKAAELSGRTNLLEGILYELADWKALAALSESTTTENPAEKWAYRAAYTRLAGEQKEFDIAVRELRKLADGKADRDSRAFVAAKGLLLNDRPAEGLDLLRTIPERRELLFDILCARLDFAAALDLAVKEIPNDKEMDMPSLDFARARLLCLLGDKEGEKLFDHYGANIKVGIDSKWVESLLAEEIRAGLKEKAFVHAAKALSVAAPKTMRYNDDAETRAPPYFAQLFPEHSTNAAVWWSVLRRQFEEDSPVAVLRRVNELLEGKIAAEKLHTWIAKVYWIEPYETPLTRATPYFLAKSSTERQALAEAAAKVGLDDLASSLLEKADGRDSLLRLGDLLAAKKQWMKAADRYQQAWKNELLLEWERANGMRIRSLIGRVPYDPKSLYLAGNALVRAGQEKEGKKLIAQAHQIPFADAAIRFDFLRALAERGHKEAARRETELLLRVSEPNTYYSGAALRRFANDALMRKDYLKAAEGFEQSMLRCLHSNTNFVSNAAFANVPAQIHQLRASALLAAGKLDEALKQVELALTDSPGYVDLPIALVPELERRGHKKEATDLFNRCYGAYEKVCRDYPRCAWAHNSAAWLSACCRRNLDRALRHADKAIELAPNNAGYLDTLAEVHFQHGDKEKAVALQKRAIALDPKKTYYHKQLKRLESGDPSAALPPENDD
ncbi:MAG: tetratricopeptide repeat protein [Gemmataceae bacterium]